MKVQKGQWKAYHWQLKHLLNCEIPPDCIVKSCCFIEEHAVDSPPPPPQPPLRISTKYILKIYKLLRGVILSFKGSCFDWDILAVWFTEKFEWSNWSVRLKIKQSDYPYWWGTGYIRLVCSSWCIGFLARQVKILKAITYCSNFFYHLFY